MQAEGPRELEVLVAHLGVVALRRTQVLTQHVFNRLHSLPPHVRDRTMLALMRDVSSLAEDEESLAMVSALANLRFVPNAQGELQVERKNENAFNIAIKRIMVPEARQSWSCTGEIIFEKGVSGSCDKTECEKHDGNASLANSSNASECIPVEIG